MTALYSIRPFSYRAWNKRYRMRRHRLDLNERHPDAQNGGFTLLIAGRLGGLVFCGRRLADLEGVARAKCQECARGRYLRSVDFTRVSTCHFKLE